eukprot:scaffold8727_cov62-Cyclotella_meneghiniana.AAC.3
MAATKIASIWRGHTQHISYRGTLNGMTFTSDILSAYMFWYLFTHTASSSSHQRIRQAAAVTLIQSKLRALLQKKHFARTISAVAQLQASVRMLKVVHSFNRQKRSSTIIATQWRVYKCKKEYQQIIKAAIITQTIIRRCLALVKTKDLRQQRRILSATVIQANWRAYAAMMFYRRNREGKSQLLETPNCCIFTSQANTDMCAIFLLAAIKCQASIRRGLATKEVENLRQLRRVASAIVIQANWRAYEAMTYYKQIKHDVTSLQATVRKWQAMKFLNKYKRAATNIACAWRRRCCSIKFTRAIEDIIICQSIARRRLGKRIAFMIIWHMKKKMRKERFQRRVTSAKLIQTNWFAYLEKKQNEAATKISSGWRRHCDENKYKRMSSCVNQSQGNVQQKQELNCSGTLSMWRLLQISNRGGDHLKHQSASEVLDK